MTQSGSPVTQQRRLRTELRRAREQAGMTQKDVADTFGWHPSKVIRLETGAVTVDVADLLAMLRHYGMTDQSKIDDLLAAARASKEHVWWDKYRTKSNGEFITFLSYESAAVRIRQFQALILPGMLQTESYARAVIKLFDNDDESIDRAVRVRLERQRILDLTDPPEMFFILDEAAIRRQVGGADVMATQLRKLKELAQRPNINIQIVPFTAGAHVGIKGSFSIFEFAGDDEDFVAYSQQTFKEVQVRTPQETSTYVETFYELETTASPTTDFDRIIDTVLGELKS